MTNLLTDPRTPVLLTALLLGGMACVKFSFAMTARHTGFPWKSALAVSAWVAVYAARHGLAVLGADWRDIAWVHWLAFCATGGGFFGMVRVVMWKMSAIHVEHDLLLRIAALEDKVDVMRAAGYKTSPPQT